MKPKAETAEAASERQLDIALDDIEPNPDQPRQEFDESGIEELAQSIKSQGVIQPIVVRRVGQKHQLVAGERRVRAARRAGLTRIPARVIQATADAALEKALVENLQREDLNPIYQAQAYQKLQEREGLTQEQIAERVGKKRATIANTVRLLRLPQAIQTDILAGRLSEGHARAILALDSAKQQLEIRDRILREGLSVRQTEALIRSKTASGAQPSTARGSGRKGKADPLILSVEEKLTLRLGTRVRIQSRSARKGRIIIAYSSLEDFERIVAAMGVELKD